MVYAMWPRAHRYISGLLVLALIYMGFHYIGWWLWAFLITAMNIITWRQRQAPDYPEFPRSRWVLAVVGLILLVLTFTPVPFHVRG